MFKIHMVFKSGNEYHFRCKTYSIETFQVSGDLARFSYNDVAGECPVFFRAEDVELIAVEKEED